LFEYLVANFNLSGMTYSAVELDLSSNRLTGTIPTTYGLFSDIKRLDLGDNAGVTGTIPTELANLSSLENLLLSGTTLSGIVGDALCALPLIKDIDVDNTPATCDCCAGLGQNETGKGETGQGETGQGGTGQGDTGQGDTGQSPP
jgi:hypothetical protein